MGRGVFTKYNKIEETVKELKDYYLKLEFHDLSIIKDLKILFALTGTLQGISISNGWGAEFLFILQKFDQFDLYPIRQTHRS